jgi:hypothetical protein
MNRQPFVPRRSALAATLSAAFLVSPAHGRAAVLWIDQAWARPAPAGASDAGYLTITNRGRAPDVLIGVSVAASRAASIHQSRLVGGMMTMRPLRSVTIAPGATVRLEPGGLHLMLEHLKRPLTPGAQVPAILTFARAGRVRVQLQIGAGPPGAAMPGM